MKDQSKLSPRYRLLRYLAAIYTLFIIYVSLTPFSGWQEQGISFVDVLVAPPAQTFTLFDATLNFLSYLPLGFLLTYMWRGRMTPRNALMLSIWCGVLLSFAMEFTQLYLPARVSSNTDILSNSLGTLAGAAAALFIANYTWLARIIKWHERWLKHGRINDLGLALAILWMFAQVNPSLPMLGSVFIREVARWQFDIVQEPPFNWLECTVVSLNLLLLGILLSTLMRERRHTMNALLLVLGGVTLAKFLTAAVLLKSWAILLWLNSEAIIGILVGLLLFKFAMQLTRNKLLWAGMIAAVVYLALMQTMLLEHTPATAMRLYHWHYLHMLNYNGLSQLINMLFPLLFIAYLWRTRIRK